METHSSILAWMIPWKGAWRATVHRLAESDIVTEHKLEHKGAESTWLAGMAQ